MMTIRTFLTHPVSQRWLKRLGWTIGIIFLLLLILWGLLAWYVQSHKKELLKMLTEKLSTEINGEVIVKDMEATFWADFPHCTFALKDVSVRDSLWSQHHHDLLHVEQLLVRTSYSSLLQRKAEVKKLIARHGAFYLFTDSTGYSNAYLLKKKRDTRQQSSSLSFRAFALEDMDITFINRLKNKFISIHINSINGLSDKTGDIWHTKTETDILIHQLAFNTARGMFLKEATVKGPLLFDYLTATKDLRVDGSSLKISGVPVALTAQFYFADTAPPFVVRMKSDAVPFPQARQWVTRIIASKMDSIDFKNPIAMSCTVEGHMRYRDTPMVKVNWVVKDNELYSPYGDFTNCSFTGEFNNHVNPFSGYNDPNSNITFRNFKGTFGTIPIQIDSLHLQNLIYPLLTTHVHSKFPVTAINDMGGEDFPFEFGGGTAEADIYYRGGVRSDDTLFPDVQGFARIKDVSLLYLPRGLAITGVSATLQLSGDNLLLRDVTISTPGGTVNMSGSADHFFRFYFSQPGLVNLKWQATSNSIDLSSLSSFIGKRKKVKQAGIRKPVNTSKHMARTRAALEQLDKVLDECTADLSIRFNKVRYRKFFATNVQAHAVLTSNAIILENVSLNHAGGSLRANATVGQTGDNNPLTIQANLNRVDVPELFTAFENFGQNAIGADNLSGFLNADVQVTGMVGQGGMVKAGSVTGTVHFKLDGGRLKEFEPFIKISKFAFKKRGLNDVQFQTLENNLDFQQGRIIIHPLLIQSTAFNMLVQGVYAPPSGTTISIALPLGNPSSSNERWKKKGKIGPGIIVYLLASDGPDGKVKIGWDITKRGRAQAEGLVQDSTDVH